ncbi:MAG: glycine--tRNA ligase subunit beta [Thiohalocapsa sp.]|nr:glycine--tRNA ligase subunit beta [Thiohalocapsa sp.]MCF7990231.1 glycine--tRNA ligase subunit beta [Thiohalocapsa sp.]
MDQHADFLVEIGTEELPPTALRTLAEAFAAAFTSQLDEHRLTHGEVTIFATPRRLALTVAQLSARQPDQIISRRGPAVAAAFSDDGTPTKAAEGFARSCGVSVSELEREETEKGAWLGFRQRREGEAALTLLPRLVTEALAALPIPKRMRWGNGEETFVRPVHWICMLYGEQRVPGRLLGIETTRQTRGHRFHHPAPVDITAPGLYAEALRAAFVEPVFAARRERIASGVKALAESAGGKAGLNDALLDEVTGLCEWPVPLLGRFDEAFLDVPQEALIETMQKNQKYFPVFAEDGSLLPRFITVSNIESTAPELVRAGNERVIRPRFADAKFFWDQDRRTPLGGRREALKTIVFQHKLGTVWDKSERVAELCRAIAVELGEDPSPIERAARLGKCDLVTHMVGEFGSLQGIMGRYYAIHDGEAPCVSAAMEEQYLPRHAGDRLPQSICGTVLALADKLDTLVGVFAIGERPSGVKDPYGLRRAAIGVLRLLVETPLALDLRWLLKRAADGLTGVVDVKDSVDEVLAYILDRLNGYYGDQGIGADVVDAVVAVGATAPSDMDRRIRAVAAFKTMNEAQALAAANKRIRNILKKSGPDASPDARIDPALLVEDAERALAQRLTRMHEELAPLREAQDYAGMLRTLASLRPEIDGFFDDVMVMDEDPALRANRIAMLRSVEELFSATADISRLH